MPDTRARWPVRVCAYCHNEFRKQPTYATCGHPRCVRTHRAMMSKSRREFNSQWDKRRLATWDPPDTYAPDDAGRRKIHSMLVKLGASRTDAKTLPHLVQVVAIKTKSRPAEVLEVW